MIFVTCAIIQHQNKVLAVQRNKHMDLPLKWEFPGGKIEPNETEEDCIIREILEELNIEIKIVSRLKPSKYNYPNKSICLVPFIANYSKGNIELLEHRAYKWLHKAKLENLDWAEADIPIVKDYLKNG